MLYIKDSLDYIVRSDIHVYIGSESSFESLFIEIKNCAQKDVIVGLIYRPPSQSITNFIDEMEVVLEKMSSENKKCYLLGDFNIDLLKFETHNQTLELLNLLYSFTFRPLIDKPTRITSSTATLIDNVFTNDIALHNSEIILSDVSDHLPIITHGPCITKKMNTTASYYWRRNTSEKNIRIFIGQVESVDWNSVVTASDANDCYSQFIQKLDSLYDACVPYKKYKTKSTSASPWLSKGILKSIRRKHKLYKKYLHNPSAFNERKYKQYRNRLTVTIRAAKKNFFVTSLEKERNNIKNTWKIINLALNKTTAKSSTNNYFNVNNNTINEPQSIAECFNDFFTSIGPKLASTIPRSNTDPVDYIKDNYPHSFFLTPITRDELITCINKLPTNKSPGHDGFTGITIKQIAPFILDPLLRIFNLSFTNGVVPDKLKLARVVPIFKNGDPHTISNYRPISILPCFSKILERLVANRLNSFLKAFDILSSAQYGFRANYSTQLAVIDLIDKITQSLDKSQNTIGVFLDLSKAFDTIDHDILLDKLLKYGVRGIALDWFRSYLSDRKQFVEWEHQRSTFQTIKCGVPQGSILGPILFLIYINDLCNSSKILSYILFADDTNIFYSCDNLQAGLRIVNRELRKIATWLTSNRLSINVNKTACMYFTNTNTDIESNIYINDSIIQKASSVKFLGIIIDEKVSWKNHCQSVHMSISRNLGVLRKLKQVLPPQGLLSLYNTLILPHLQYGVLAWGNTYQTYLNKIYIIQKKALRLINNSGYRSHTRPLFFKFKCLTVFNIYKYHLGVLMYKFDRQILPAAIQNMFTLNSSIHNYNTRSSSKFHIFSARTNFYKSTVRHQGPILWNSLSCLPPTLTVYQFKKNLKSFLLTSDFNS